ncbi:MAG: AAA family ATPase [Gemmatimonadaceae bacterium]|nr:AAA family ATPase [Gemmatimonadaceae bacterium]
MAEETLSLHLTSLGAARVEVGANSPNARGFGASKPLALLAYLAAAPGQTASRERLVDLLWSDVDPDAGRHALRQTIWHIRKKLHESVLTTPNGLVAIGVPVRWDRTELLTAAEQRDFTRVVELYTGEFLAGFATPGGAEFEQWAELERRRLRSAFVVCAEAEVRRLLSIGRYRDAIALARRARDTDLFNESAWRLLIEAAVASNDPVAILGELGALEQHLRDEELEPEPSTKALIKAARAHASAGAPHGGRVSGGTTTDAANGERESASRSGAFVTDLIGREREFGSLLALWDEVREGSGVRRAHLRASAGLGKSRLLADLRARLRASRSRVVAVRANPGERSLSYAFVTTIAEALAALPGARAVPPSVASTLLALSPALGSVYEATIDAATGEDALRRRTAAIAELLRAVADEVPVALLLDDIQWADATSRQLLSGALSRIEHERLLVVSAGRPVPEGDLALAGTLPLDLAPLDATQVEELITAVAPLPGASWCADAVNAMAESSAGSPLDLIETLQLLIERDLLSVTPQGWQCGSPDALLAALREGGALRHRLARLDRDQRWAVLTCATAGRPLAPSVLSALEGPPSDATLHSLEVGGLLARAGGGWQCAHDLIAEAMLDSAPDSARTAAAVAVGRALLATGERDESTTTLALSMMAQGGVTAELVQATARVARARGLRGDRAGLRALTTAIAGSHPRSSELERALRDALSRSLRISTATFLGAAAALVVAVGLTAHAFLAQDAQIEPMLIVADSITPDFIAVGVKGTGLSSEEWPIGAPVRLRARAPMLVGQAQVPLLHPNGDRYLSRVFADSGEIDVVRVRPNGREERITFSPGDDYVVGFSPDGRFALLTTSRLDTLTDRTDIAVMELATGALRFLTRSPDFLEASASWSPDGASIAWARHSYRIGEPSAVCVGTSTAGADDSPRCWPLGLGAAPLAWRSPTQLGAVQFTRAGNGDQLVAFSLIDLIDGTVRRVPEFDCRGSLAAYPSGWRICTDEAQPSMAITPLWEPTRVRTVTFARRPRIILIEGAPAPTPWVAAMRIVQPRTARLIIGSPSSLAVESLDSLGRVTARGVVQWHSLDPLIATVDSLGVVTPRAHGSVGLVASLSGWRADTATFSVEPRTSALLLTERWEAHGEERWVTFASPRR